MTRLCTLEQTAGLSVECPEGACPFWEPGGAVLLGRCAFERVDLSLSPGVAHELLQIRQQLEPPASAEAERDARQRFHRLLNETED